MGCGDCARRREAFLKKQAELKSIPIQKEKPQSNWKFTRKNNNENPLTNQNVSKRADRIKRRNEEIKIHQEANKKPSMPSSFPNRKTP